MQEKPLTYINPTFEHLPTGKSKMMFGVKSLFASAAIIIGLNVSAQRYAEFLLDHPNLSADKVPYWDYNAPVTKDTYRDVSAASIMASALLELEQYSSGDEQNKYVEAAEKILQSLSSKTYRTALGKNGGFILMHSVGSLPHKSEVDVPLTYADYYFIEALLRYDKWYLKK